MNVNKLQKEIKDYWLEDMASTKNISDLATYSEIYISILKKLDELQSLKQLSESETTESENKPTPSQDHASNFAINDYVFYRRLRGGIGKQVSDSETVIELIPETAVHEEELETGDIVKIEKHEYGKNRHRYTKQPFEKVEVTNDDNNYDLIEYNNAIVTYDSTLNRYTIQSYWEEDGIKSLPTLLVNPEDVERLDLKDGYIVDVAHYANQNTVRVRWSYQTDDFSRYEKPQKPTFYKKSVTNSTSKKVYDSNIKDKTIFMVGGTSRVNRYREEIEKRGGQLTSTDSDREAIITQMIDNSNIVIIPIFETSHIKMKIAKSHCQKLDIPYLILENGGRSIFINELECLINQSDMN
ncbi:DUF2325 domain-containing protein [Staphylococcus pettenkoferi]|uniref:DUF2325 domain-containing protein n=1 Tax=Staphylococcus pettenkoferi TaxID=170573 RepID=UPI0025565C83|nr:DUF2325 domain-containing protein [Staphylococcus pettenkoferi]MDK7284312.1 DUF2325 domain-containing protein [Staphylococcus pettenkoferi]